MSRPTTSFKTGKQQQQQKKAKGPPNIFKWSGTLSGNNTMNKNISPIICLNNKILDKQIILSKVGSGRQAQEGNFKDAEFQLRQFTTIVMIYHFTHYKSTNDISYVSVWLQN